ncbi:hypothetical protein [Shewanella septentrionalis]|nr:hypothetical protein [Shewanella septentrionalis]
MKTFFFLIVAIGLTACSSNPPPPPEPTGRYMPVNPDEVNINDLK